MQSKSAVEIADRLSRKRALGAAIAAAAFIAVQIFARPFFVPGSEADRRVQVTLWAVNAIALLLLLATGGGFIYNARLRALVLDEVARHHYKTAVITAFWVAMASAMGVFLFAGSGHLSAREAVYLIVTPSIAVALLAFSFLERRAHRDE